MNSKNIAKPVHKKKWKNILLLVRFVGSETSNPEQEMSPPLVVCPTLEFGVKA